MRDLLIGLLLLLGDDRYFLLDLRFGLEFAEFLVEGGVHFLLDPVDLSSLGGDF